MMKKRMFKLSALCAVFMALAITSCSSDDDNNGTDPNPTPNDELTGKITENLTLDPTVQYKLNGVLSVESGTTLTIPGGTQIVSNKGTDNYIVVQKGADINIQGTASTPVLMTSADGKAGDWGGLVILGNAVTTAGENATAEVGGLIYGGTDNADNSGSIKYLTIVGAGAQINPESQYNGLTLYAVGSGTTIENVAIINGADDGVEFFGGTVSVTNFYSENNQDDSVDWTEGWSGTLTNAYVLHTLEGFSTAIEADGSNGNPKLVNFTAVSTSPGIGLQFKKQSGATFTNAYLEGYAPNVDMVDGGAVGNVIVDEVPLTDAAADVFNGTKLDISTWTWKDANL